MDSDSIGNLWVGSETGLFRIDKNYKIYSFTGTNANFESNHITALRVPPSKSGNSLELFVACDKEANFSMFSDLFNGSDQPPNVNVYEVDRYGREIGRITHDFFETPNFRDQFQLQQTSLANIEAINAGDTATASGTQRFYKKKVSEADIDGASFHYFNGMVWDKWKIAGVRSMFVDGEYVWVTSNIRVRRLLIPR